MAPEERVEQACPPHCRRRSASARRRAPRPPLPVPGELHGHERVLGTEALATARELKSRGDSLAMMISDQRMPGMLGSEVLAKSREVYPLARRVLLTAYSDIEAAVKAINEAHLDHYLSKPWDPPEERLFPVVDDLLDALAGRISARSEGIEAGRPSVVAAIARDQGLPGEQSHSLSLARCRRGTRTRAHYWTRPEWAPTSFRRCSSKTESPCCAIRNPARWPSASAGRSRLHSMCTTL